MTSPGRGKVLVMDDESIVRDIAGEMLRFMGYEVVLAEDGDEAVSLYEGARKVGLGFDAVIMDLTVPGGMGGRETLKKMLEFDPGVKAIVSSGYSNDPIMSSFREYGFMGAVAKPYRIEELDGVLQNIISSGN